MKFKPLFKLTILLQIMLLSDAQSASVASSSEKIFETTFLPGGLRQLVVNMPEGSNYFSLHHDGTAENVRRGTVKKDGISLPMSCIDSALKHKKGVHETGGSIFFNCGAIIIDSGGTYKAEQSILIIAKQMQMAQTGFVWGSEGQQCILSAKKGSPSPLRGIELIGGEKDSDGNFRALVYGTLNFEASTLKDTLVPTTFEGMPDAVKDGVIFLGVKAIKLIIESPDA